tara:strand:- start:76 stop:357 length:282 start_codon:yes stop_codon:yes gene_type:complete
MALTKEIEEDRIEVVTPYKHIQVRTATVIKEDGEELTRKFHRKVIECGKCDASGNWVDTDISGESADVKAFAAQLWTQSVKDAYKAKILADRS